MKLKELLEAVILTNPSIVAEKEILEAAMLCFNCLDNTRNMYKFEAEVKRRCDFERLKIT